jgi:hypothetical protein
VGRDRPEWVLTEGNEDYETLHLGENIIFVSFCVSGLPLSVISGQSVVSPLQRFNASTIQRGEATFRITSRWFPFCTSVNGRK